MRELKTVTKQYLSGITNIRDNSGKKYGLDELFDSGGNIYSYIIRPVVCGGCGTRARISAPTSRTRGYCSLTSSAESQHAPSCPEDFHKRANTVVSNNTYVSKEKGSYVLDLVSFPYSRERTDPQEVHQQATVTKRHARIKDAQVRKERTKYLRTVRNIAQLLHEHRSDPEKANVFRVMNRATGKTYMWDDFFYDLTQKEQAQELLDFFLWHQHHEIAVPPLAVRGEIRTIWDGETSKYLLTTKDVEVKEHLRVAIYRKNKAPTNSRELPQRQDTVLTYGIWSLLNQEYSTQHGARIINFWWNHPGEVVPHIW